MGRVIAQARSAVTPQDTLMGMAGRSLTRHIKLGVITVIIIGMGKSTVTVQNG